MQDIVLYGVNSIQTERTLDYVKQRGDRVVAFCDGNENLWGREFFGIKCLDPDALSKNAARVVVTSSGIRAPEVMSMLLQCGINGSSVAEYVWENEAQSFDYVYHSLFDEQSKKTFETVLGARRKLLYDDIINVALPFNEQYFSFFNTPADTCVYVDCGAFVGESVEKYLNSCLGAEKIIAFEPSIKSYKALRARTKRLINEWALDDTQIECVMAGIGEKNDVCDPASKYSSLTAAAAAGRGNVPMYSIDSYLSGGRVDFIKADIEGAELSMLKGASNTIKQHKPKLAISIYHSIWDFYEIPLYIRTLMPEYKMAIRHYTNVFFDTVLYCWE